MISVDSLKRSLRVGSLPKTVVWLYFASPLFAIAGAAFTEIFLWNGPARYLTVGSVATDVLVAWLLSLLILFCTARSSSRLTNGLLPVMLFVVFALPVILLAERCGGSGGSYCEGDSRIADLLSVVFVIGWPIAVLALLIGVVQGLLGWARKP